ncbi:MAG: efflux RND transporter permease subunit [Candidatus Binataceae bacterium]
MSFSTFNDDSPQLYLGINRTMARSLGVDLNQVFETLETYLGSSCVNQFDQFNQNFQVRMQTGTDYRRRFEDIGNLYVVNRSGHMVPLGRCLTLAAFSGRTS